MLTKRVDVKITRLEANGNGGRDYTIEDCISHARAIISFPLSKRIALSTGSRDDAKHFRVLTSMSVHRVSLMSKTMIRNWIGHTPARCDRSRRRRIDSAMGCNTRADNAEKMRHVSATKLLYPFSIRDRSSTRTW